MNVFSREMFLTKTNVWICFQSREVFFWQKLMFECFQPRDVFWQKLIFECFQPRDVFLQKLRFECFQPRDVFWQKLIYECFQPRDVRGLSRQERWSQQESWTLPLPQPGHHHCYSHLKTFIFTIILATTRSSSLLFLS